METNNVLDSDLILEGNKTEIEIVESNKFLLLYMLSFGLYEIWWMYKMWRFFKEKDSLDISPVARAIFAIFFAYGLFEKIKYYAKRGGYTKGYSSELIFFGMIAFMLVSYLPDPFWLVGLGAGFIFIPVVNAFTYAVQNSDKYVAVSRSGYSNRQIVLMVAGIIFWILVLIGLYAPEV